MNIDKTKTLEQVHDAIDIVEDARAISGLTQNERLDLEKASVKLRNLERTIIRMKTNELVASLTADADALKELSNQIKQSADKLSKIATTIENAANVVNAFINSISSATSAGLL